MNASEIVPGDEPYTEKTKVTSESLTATMSDYYTSGNTTESDKSEDLDQDLDSSQKENTTDDQSETESETLSNKNENISTKQTCGNCMLMSHYRRELQIQYELINDLKT
ncbi:uncharacterized protein LOC134204996 [Armigeres subalbatus]|uniref:uncharacterized protein LOC134204996 n=1 Tax=Armigeres subalbatus TaxID=124917 RepID=UPI002ED1BBBE